MRPLGIIAIAAGILMAGAAFAEMDQKTSHENMVRDRGETRVQDQTQVLTRGRVGSQGVLPGHALILSGTLIDASCPDRSVANLRAAPQPMPAQMPAETQGAAGIDVAPKVLQSERSDITPHQVPDMFTRQDDPSCGITGSTKGYALLMDNGRLLNLDEGGNTYAANAVNENPAGRAMLNGTGRAIKPRVVLKGWILGDRVIVDSIQSFGSSPRT